MSNFGLRFVPAGIHRRLSGALRIRSAHMTMRPIRLVSIAGRRVRRRRTGRGPSARCPCRPGSRRIPRLARAIPPTSTSLYYCNDDGNTAKLSRTYQVTPQLTWHTPVGRGPQVLGCLHDLLLQPVQRLRQPAISSYTFPVIPGQPAVPGVGVFDCPPLTVLPKHYSHYVETKKYFSNEINITSHSDSPLQWIFGLFQYNERNYQTPRNFVRARSNTARDAAQYHGDRAGGAESEPGNLPPATGNARQFLCSVCADRLELHADLEAHHRIALHLRHPERRRAIPRAVLRPAGLSAGIFLARYSAALYFGCVYAGERHHRLATRRSPIASMASVAIIRASAHPRICCRTAIGPATWAPDWTSPTGTLGVEWDARPNTLAYLKYSRGYKSGGFNASTISVNPESLQSISMPSVGRQGSVQPNVANQRRAVRLQLHRQADSVVTLRQRSPAVQPLLDRQHIPKCSRTAPNSRRSGSRGRIAIRPGLLIPERDDQG